MAGSLFHTTWRQSRQPLFFRDTAEVLRLTEISDGAGGNTPSEDVIATVACSLQETQATGVTGREGTAAGEIQAVTLFFAYLPVGTDCGPKDVLRIGGVRFEVVDTNEGRTEARNLAVNLRKVE